MCYELLQVLLTEPGVSRLQLTSMYNLTHKGQFQYIYQEHKPLPKSAYMHTYTNTQLLRIKPSTLPIPMHKVTAIILK